MGSTIQDLDDLIVKLNVDIIEAYSNHLSYLIERDSEVDVMLSPFQFHTLYKRVHDAGMLVGYPELADTNRYLVLVDGKTVRSCTDTIDLSASWQSSLQVLPFLSTRE